MAGRRHVEGEGRPSRRETYSDTTCTQCDTDHSGATLASWMALIASVACDSSAGPCIQILSRFTIRSRFAKRSSQQALVALVGRSALCIQ